MDAQLITSRLLSSLSAGKDTDLIKKYLLAFGVTNPKSTDLPPVFKDKHLPEWKAFVDSFNLKQDDQEKKRLYTILEFVRYMRHLGINPFSKPVKLDQQKSTFNVVDAYSRLLTQAMLSIAKKINAVLLKTSLMSQFKVTRTKIILNEKSGIYALVGSYVLEVKRKNAHIEQCLTSLQGLLYTMTEPPIQLREKYQKLPVNSKAKAKSLLDKSDTLLSVNSTFGWLPLIKSKEFDLYIVRAKDSKLVLRYVVNINPDFSLDSKHKMETLILKLWKTSFKLL